MQDRKQGCFPTTSWPCVFRAAQQEGPEAEEAWETFCRGYWLPLFAYVRHWGWSAEDAQDLTQDFFKKLIENQALEGANPEKGRLRSYLLSGIKNSLKDAIRKRGRRLTTMEWPGDVEDVKAEAPNEVFEREWALNIVEVAQRRLFEAEDKDRRLEEAQLLFPCMIHGGSSELYAELARRLGKSEAAVKMATSRLRQRWRKMLKEVIAHTIPDPAEVESERQHLVHVLSSTPVPGTCYPLAHLA
jgi:RNA polymerase sigma-70 factor (ECF subfamily)